MLGYLLYDFMELIKNGTVEIYNEFSLQHELGIFLRNRLSKYKVQFERNTRFFGISGTVKHEIDIVVYNDNEKMAIELKFPMNGQYPEQMYSFIKDICFMEQLKNAGFSRTYCLTVVNDKNFYSGTKQDKIYSFFRKTNPISGEIIKPTGKREDRVFLNNEYRIEWINCGSTIKYYLIEI